ncbi:DUF6036 family nucleotidyltransferase [Bacillus suaedae]|uniref:DUF6036 domain-containing protein n=1 Tax=Halalkalibacter suaedae TaxID=2822140 RepID=A0A940WWK9_9BACI|nr:DUF6036 family nucleotidyltransferase [Bacillus suaedae]MBP3951932.1 hypothetical protein [Bacillus suaedae]
MKNRTVYRSSEDVFRALYELDYDLSQLNLKSKIHLTIFGGTALLLMTEAHVTKDIDAFIQYQDADNRIRSILAKYSVNDKMRGVMELPPLDEIIATTKEINGETLKI